VTFQRRSHATASIACSSLAPVRCCNNITFASCDGGIDGLPIRDE
jgi:hypothetical protein